MSQGVLIEMVHGFPLSHSFFTFYCSLMGWWSSPNKISSRKLNLNIRKLQILRSLKLLHAFWIDAHCIIPCSKVSNQLSSHKLHMPSCLSLVCHALIGSPSSMVNHTIVDIFHGSDATNVGRFFFLFKSNAFHVILHPSSFVFIASWLQLCILFLYSNWNTSLEPNFLAYAKSII